MDRTPKGIIAPSAEDDAEIFRKRVELFVGATPIAVLAVVINACVLAWFLRGAVPSIALASWLGAVLLLSLVRWGNHRLSARDAAAASEQLGPARRLRRAQIGVALSGALWAAVSLLLFPADDLAAQAILTVILAGICAGSVNTFSVFLRFSQFFLLLTLLPFILRMALLGTETGIAIASVATLYLVLMLSIARRYHDTLVDGLRTGRARERAEARVTQEAFYDSLTSLPNRRLICDRLQLDIARHVQEGHIGALLFMDFDRFQRLNNSLGHGVGDRLLCLMTERVVDLLGGTHSIGRLEGDRFVVVLPELGDSSPVAANRARQQAENLRHVMAVPLQVDGRDIQLSVSAGIALFPNDGDTPEDLLRAAESALTQAKAAGRDCTRFFLPQMQAAAKARMDLEVGLRQALRDGELTLYYQPQCDHRGRILSVEALLRWPRASAPDMVASPGVFVPMAEDSGMIHELGEWVITEALRDIARLQDLTGPHCPQRVALNISPVQFRQPDFAGALATRLLADGLDPQRLELELTEHVLVASFQDIARKMQRLRELGVHFSVDDFGTGYSSLSYLKRLPLDALKIDRSFVRDVASDASDATIVETIIDMAHRLGLRVVAEGVDKPEALDFLEARGCDRYQGYLFFRPMPFDALVDALLNPTAPPD